MCFDNEIRSPLASEKTPSATDEAAILGMPYSATPELIEHEHEDQADLQTDDAVGLTTNTQTAAKHLLLPLRENELCEPRTPSTPRRIGMTGPQQRTRLYRMWKATEEGRIRHASVHSQATILPNPAGMEYLDQFKADCKRKYTTLCRCWRDLLDPGGNGRVSFFQFVPSARLMGYRNPAKLWAFLDHNKSGFVTLECWDPVASRSLMEFRDICYKQYGGMETAFKFGMDRNGSATIQIDELRVFCQDMEFKGDVANLFQSLDQDSCGTITVDELEFLTRYVGEKYRSKAVDKRTLAIGAHLARTVRVCKPASLPSTMRSTF
jgi:hypothetical protein